MGSDAVISTAADPEGDLVIAVKPTDHGVAAALIDNRDVVPMSGCLG